MYVCIKLFIEFDEPYRIIPTDELCQDYSVAPDRLRPYLDDGFEVVCTEPLLFSVPKENAGDDSDTAPFAGEKGPESDSDEADRRWMETDTYLELPDAYYDAGRYVYMVKELENVSAFDRKKYEPDDYDCTLMYERDDWVYKRVYSFRPPNYPFSVYEELPFKEFPYWPDTVTELSPEEKAAEKERIQSIYNSLRRGEIRPEDVDIVDLLIINGMMRKELAEKEKDTKIFLSLMQQYEDGVPFEELRRQLLEYEAGKKQ